MHKLNFKNTNGKWIEEFHFPRVPQKGEQFTIIKENEKVEYITYFIVEVHSVYNMLASSYSFNITVEDITD